MRISEFLIVLAIVSTPAVGQDKFEYAPNKSTTRSSLATHQVGDDGRDQTRFRTACLSVVGQEPFCKCLARHVPSGLNFDQYVVMLSKTKEENGYDKLGKNLQRTYDSIPQLRDKCAIVQASAP